MSRRGLNVFLCSLQSPYEWDIPSYGFWRENFKPALEALGCTVLEPEGLDLAEPLARAHDPEWHARDKLHFGERLFAAVKAAHARTGLDLLFGYFYADHLNPDVLSAVRDLGIPVVNFFCDNLRQFESVRPLARAVTLNWVPEQKAIPLYRELGAPAIHLPMGVNPSYYAMPDGEEIPQISFIGYADHLRMKLLEPALDAGLPLRIYGRGWTLDWQDATGRGDSGRIGRRRFAPRLRGWRRVKVSIGQHFGRLTESGLAGEWRHFAAPRLIAKLRPRFEGHASASLPHREYLRILGRSAVTLGINRCPHPSFPFDRPIAYSRLRDLEAPLVGACYLTEYCDDVAHLYEVGTEIVCYRDSEDLIAMATALLEDRAWRERLRRAGRAAVLARHTWAHRFQVLFSELGLDAPPG